MLALAACRRLFRNGCLPLHAPLLSRFGQRDQKCRVAALVLLGGSSFSACGSRHPTVSEAALPVCADAGGQYQEDAWTPVSSSHTEAPQTYDGKPPAGGPHSGCWGSWGVHSTPLPPERFVHNLEHGGIVLTYNCPDGCSKELRWMQEFAVTNELVVVTEYPQLTSRFGISAWQARAYSDCLSPDFVRDFYARRVDRGPEQFTRPPPEPPSSCR